jgi:hypothetical protein
VSFTLTECVLAVHEKLVKSQHKIASIDLQLVRKEAVVVGGDTASEISEVQSVQVRTHVEPNNCWGLCRVWAWAESVL